MKRELFKVNYTQSGIDDEISVERRRTRQNLLRELGLLYPYTSSNNIGKQQRFSKYYETESDYIKDKALANMLIYGDKEVPTELYNRLYYTKKELQKNS